VDPVQLFGGVSQVIDAQQQVIHGFVLIALFDEWRADSHCVKGRLDTFVMRFKQAILVRESLTWPPLFTGRMVRDIGNCGIKCPHRCRSAGFAIRLVISSLLCRTYL
jgi:hypothetical protein